MYLELEFVEISFISGLLTLFSFSVPFFFFLLKRFFKSSLRDFVLGDFSLFKIAFRLEMLLLELLCFDCDLLQSRSLTHSFLYIDSSVGKIAFLILLLGKFFRVSFENRSASSNASVCLLLFTLFSSFNY